MKKILVLSLCMIIAWSVNCQCTTVNSDGSCEIYSCDYTDAVVSKLVGDTWQQIGSLTNHIFIDPNAQATDGKVVYRFENDNMVFSTIYLSSEVDGDNINLSWQCDNDYTVYQIYQCFDDPDREPVLINSTTNKQISFARPNQCEVKYLVRAVTMNNIYECTSQSNVTTISKNDVQEPEIPHLYPITVNNDSGRIIISWQRSSSSDVMGYVICKRDQNQTRIAIDTIYGADINSYIARAEDLPIDEINQISIFAFDSCWNTSPNTDTYNNIVVTATRADCSEPFAISFNQYTGSEGLINYILYLQTADNRYRFDLGTNTSYSLPILMEYGTQCKICIQAQTTETNLDVYSNEIALPIGGNDTLEYINLDNVSVSEDNMHCQINFSADSTKAIRGFDLYRQMDNNDFELVAQIDYLPQEKYEYIDNLPMSAKDHTYTYYLAAPDGCQTIFTYSNKMSSIQINVLNGNDRIRLSWNNPKPLWEINKWEIYRYNENEFSTKELIATTTAMTYLDNISSFASATDRLYYVVKAIPSQEMGFETYSANNYASNESIFFAPNAFSPKDGLNEKISVFKPECHFVRSGTYNMKIFSRNGTLLFETNDIDEGWDGTYKEKICPVGTYVYKVTFVDNEGMERKKKGTFLLFD